MAHLQNHTRRVLSSTLQIQRSCGVSAVAESNERLLGPVPSLGGVSLYASRMGEGKFPVNRTPARAPFATSMRSVSSHALPTILVETVPFHEANHNLSLYSSHAFTFMVSLWWLGPGTLRRSSNMTTRTWSRCTMRCCTRKYRP